jgi:diadenosine tetraphosphate (Ap4A) HIT family hydrolase
MSSKANAWSFSKTFVQGVSPFRILAKIFSSLYIEIADFNRAVGKVAKLKGLIETGFRTLANHGLDAHQDVFHYHVHLLGGRDLGVMIKSEEQ